jgi:hypothetical protein
MAGRVRKCPVRARCLYSTRVSSLRHGRPYRIASKRKVGGGRLLAAQALDVPIPAIVVDYTGDFQLFEEVTPDNWQTFFIDVPVYFEWAEVGIFTHYGLERGRDEWFDPAGIEWAQALDDKEFLYEESPWLS